MLIVRWDPLFKERSATILDVALMHVAFQVLFLVILGAYMNSESAL